MKTSLVPPWHLPGHNRDNDDDMIMMTVMHGPDDDMMFVNNPDLDCCRGYK